jgi:hypothetical protein
MGATHGARHAVPAFDAAAAAAAAVRARRRPPQSRRPPLCDAAALDRSAPTGNGGFATPMPGGVAEWLDERVRAERRAAHGKDATSTAPAATATAKAAAAAAAAAAAGGKGVKGGVAVVGRPRTPAVGSSVSVKQALPARRAHSALGMTPEREPSISERPLTRAHSHTCLCESRSWSAPPAPHKYRTEVGVRARARPRTGPTWGARSALPCGMQTPT